MAENHDWSVQEPVELIVALLSVAAIMVIAVAWAASIFYALRRFYRSRFTEEGCLTYTLPVNGHQLMLAVTIGGGDFIMYFLTTRKLNLN